MTNIFGTSTEPKSHLNQFAHLLHYCEPAVQGLDSFHKRGIKVNFVGANAAASGDIVLKLIQSAEKNGAATLPRQIKTPRRSSRNSTARRTT